MRIEHVALWTHDLEKSKEFYTKYFDAHAGNLYFNQKTGFKSYFLSFDEGSRLEIMHKADIKENTKDQKIGFIHIAFSVGSKENVDSLTDKLIKDGYELLSAPRTTGDGYYESCVAGPDGERIEITV